MYNKIIITTTEQLLTICIVSNPGATTHWGPVSANRLPTSRPLFFDHPASLEVTFGQQVENPAVVGFLEEIAREE